MAPFGVSTDTWWGYFLKCVLQKNMGRVHQHNTSVADRFMVAKPVLEARYARAGLGGSVLVTPTEVCATPEPVRNFRVLFNSFFFDSVLVANDHESM